ncbi:phosphopantetheine-binding protein [Gracilinema caldarium]|uniref:phosphopantetheine-binding protein n=1 Tax=Gracilinema caldarium TaxID=215591 RepID=UPI0026EE3D8E|nr:phosphopantetheine-binding protein [Gracilinema caldarium]
MIDTNENLKTLNDAKEYNNRRQEILDRVKNVLIHRLNLEITADKIDDDSPLFGMGLGLDSIDSLELVVGVEEEFGVSVPSDNLEVFLSINTLTDFILKTVERLPVVEFDTAPEKLQTYPWLKPYKALREGCLMYKADSVILEMPEQEGGLEFISWLVAGNDIILEPHRAMHALLLDNESRIIDLIYILMFDDKYWLLPTPNNPKSIKWIFEKALEKNIEMNDVSGSYQQVVCEGPYSWKVVKPLAGFEVTGLSYLRFMFAEWEENQILILRAGKTNEYGFRMFVSSDKALSLCDFLKRNTENILFYDENNKSILESCLETASREVRFPIIDITVKFGSSPVPNEIRWMVDTRKKDFIGKDFVLKDFTDASTKILAVVADTTEH